MPSSTLLVIVDADAAHDSTEVELHRILHHWPASHRPPATIRSAQQVIGEPAVLENATLVWLNLDRTDPHDLYELAGLIGERRLPAMLTRAGETEPAASEFDLGITICPPDTPSATSCAMLRTLWNQAGALHEVRGEMRALEVQQRELCTQIRQVDEELRLAAQLQREFLPTSLPQIDDLAFRVFFRPAGYVSGDIYDVAKLDEHHVGVFIADAVGHGVPAALMTMYIKRSLRTKVIDRSLDAGYRLIKPAETLATLNRDLIQQQTDHVRFATACYMLIDCRTHKATLARAGHPPPIVLRADGSTEQLEPDGSLLGVFPDEQFEQTTFQLESGDRLLLYSDGFETAFPGDEGKRNKVASDQYCQEFEDLRRSSVDAALARLQERIDNQIGSLNQRDDLTLLCVASTGKPAPQPEREPERESRPIEECRHVARHPAPSPVG